MRHREAFRARLLVVGVVVLGVLVGAPVAAHATTLKVVPIGHGTVSFTPAPQSPDATDPCSSAAAGQTTDLLDGSCAVTYAPGTVVRLEAKDGVAVGEDPATTFRRWSDDRCPPGNTRVCELTVGSEPVTIAALFSPQRVSVQLEGTAGTVSIAPAGLLGGLQPTCDVASVSQCHDDFDPDLSGPVTLTAAGAGPHVGPDSGRRADAVRLARQHDLHCDPRMAPMGLGRIRRSPEQPGPDGRLRELPRREGGQRLGNRAEHQAGLRRQMFHRDRVRGDGDAHRRP